ncbi:DNA polymerase III subunit gamma/tau [Candidatus Phytoplasma solani]|uniref:DNA polymerase III subunit gamma/tau n=1 Tax=Candidatus Phytoplasma solani TaxID=69896 RepID=UPI00358F0BB2
MSYLVLYRKYRPQTFQNVVGQKIIIQTLKNAIRYQKINHCYLFSGNKGTGKTTLAKIFSKAINCLNPQAGDVCNQCQICKQNLQASVDIIEIDGASYNGVDEIRELQDKAQYKAHTGKYKVYIIDEVHVLTVNAFNALLKILEDPPKHVVFLLITTEIYKIPETILSRSQSFSFENLNLENIIFQLKNIATLENIFISDDAIKTIASYSDGSMRNALSLLDQISSYQNSLITAEDVAEIKGLVSGSFLKKMLHSLIVKNHLKALELLHQAFEVGKNLDLLVLDLIVAFKNYLLEQIKSLKTKSTSKNKDSKQINASNEQSFHLDFVLKTLIKLQQDLKKSDQKHVLIEIAFLQICSFSSHNHNLNLIPQFNHPKPFQHPDKPHKDNIENNSLIDVSLDKTLNLNTTKISQIELFPISTKSLSKTVKKKLSNDKKNPYFSISSLKDLAMIAFDILSHQDETKRNIIANAWQKLKSNYQSSSNKTAAELLYKGQITALSQNKEMILVYRDNIACQQMLKNNIKESILKILNGKSELIKDYVCFLDKDWQTLITFFKDNDLPSLESFLKICNWNLEFYQTQTSTNNHPLIVQLAYDFFDKNIVEIIN